MPIQGVRKNIAKPLIGYGSKRCPKCSAIERIKKHPHTLCKHNIKHTKKSKIKISDNRKGKGFHKGIAYNIIFSIDNLNCIDAKTAIKILKKNNKFNNCQKCNRKDNLQLHHKDKNRKNNKLNNLMVLCSHCHMNLHKNWEKRWKKFARF